MKNYSHCRHIFSQLENFESAARELLTQSLSAEEIMRITIFGRSADDTEYKKSVEILERLTLEIFPRESAPLVSYVTQPLLYGGHYVAEVQTIDVEVQHKELDGLRYIIMESEDMRRCVMCGVTGDVEHSIREQSDELFAKITKVFDKEGFAVSDIFRQWNYIPQITACDSNNYQNYQAFNDSRTEFYRTSDWSKVGYPAATGIGMDCGAVTVDLIAVKPLNDRMYIIPMDNDLQLAAHVYSQGVLIGVDGDKVEGKSTPKFERAKALGNAEDGYICFISGTAAIRGEASVESDNAATQTVMTIENIEHLISEHTCNIYNIKLSEEDRTVHVARAYVKYAEDMNDIKMVVDDRWQHVSMVYLLADVCREELLVEIEAVSNMTV